MKNFLTIITTKYLILVATAAMAGTSSFIYWSHSHAAEMQLENKSSINLIRAIHKNHVDIALVRERLRSLDSNRTQVLISLSPDRPHLVELKESIESQIVDQQAQLETLLQTKQRLELQEKGLK